jgi:excinuclease ABC subunit A
MREDKTMTAAEIKIRGARQHNLKNIDLTIPRDRLVVITGVSGSGKSSLALDTLFAEGQRRYVESLSSYARQFVGQLDKPDVDAIEGLSPAIAIDQRSLGRNPRSTVGTATEIYDFLRLLFAHAGRPHCPRCGKEVSAVTLDEMKGRLLDLPAGTRIWLYAPVVREEEGAHRRILHNLAREGFLRVRVDGEIRELTEEIRLQRNVPHTIEVLVDRLEIRPDISTRLVDSLETAARLSEGIVQVQTEKGETLWFSESPLCVPCGLVMPALTPKLFSFNDPQGACPGCKGLGHQHEFDPDLIVPDRRLSLREGALAPWARRSPVRLMEEMDALGRHYKFDIYLPFEELPEKVQHALLYGSEGGRIPLPKEKGDGVGMVSRPFEGVIPWLKRAWKRATDPVARTAVERFMALQPCPQCGGTRLRSEAQAVRVGGKTMADLCSIPISRLQEVLSNLPLIGAERELSQGILQAIQHRLRLLEDLDLQYLALNRSSETLSGGEAQRIRLASQMGSNLVGILYILDEPSIGLHPRDQASLLNTLRSLTDSGNSMVVVEHDAATIMSADHVVDMGPGAGEQGGRVIYEGYPEGLRTCPESITGAYLSGRRQISIPSCRRSIKGPAIEVLGAYEHNLKGIDVRFPLGCLTCVTGVSGSGKSTLVLDTLYRAAARRVYRGHSPVGKAREIKGLEAVDKVVDIDQSPIGRTPRSNPATYTGVFQYIRGLLAQLPESRMRGYKAGRYSFNVKGGRCEACQGDGVRRIEMHLLPDVYATCEVCRGMRYNSETLEIRYKGYNVARVLDFTVNEASRLFENVHKIREIFQTLQAVGLGYLRLGQSATTLSGGEAQRVKLARELSRRQTGRSLYILDEPTTGLHFEDIRYLLEVLMRLVDAGNTVVVIEHNLEVIKCADYVIDLGPGAGEEGGWVVACGTPEELRDVENAPTGPYLREVLDI